MEVKITPSKTNKKQISANQTTPQLNTTNHPLTQQTNASNVDELYELLQQLLRQNKTNPRQTNENEFIVKSSMKASHIALRLEQMLLLSKTVKISGLGYAIPRMLDSIMLIKKDLNKLNKNVTIEGIEMFEQSFDRKTVTGLRVSLKIQ